MSRNISDIKGVSSKLTAENYWDLLVVYFPVMLKGRINNRRYKLIFILRWIWIMLVAESYTPNDVYHLKKKCIEFVLGYEESVQ